MVFFTAAMLLLHACVVKVELDVTTMTEEVRKGRGEKE
jgi:hypothetical protein